MSLDITRISVVGMNEPAALIVFVWIKALAVQLRKLAEKLLKDKTPKTKKSRLEKLQGGFNTAIKQTLLRN